jgi:flavin reductase (DIM6/NTAB) family NADH-FMN oxidoreductase RutF
MFVVTAVADGVRAGCLVGFTTQVSINPLRFMVCLSEKNHTFRVAARSHRLAVHALGRGQADLARLFGEQTGDEIDKFACCSWWADPQGVPVLAGAAAWFSGPILARVPMGDHVGYVIEPDDGEAADVSRAALIRFADLPDLDPGHEA